jgi:hypothetical protein
LFRGLEVLVELHTEPRALRKSYLELIEQFLHQVRKISAGCGFDHVLVNTKTPLDVALSSYLSARQKAGQRVARSVNR